MFGLDAILTSLTPSAVKRAVTRIRESQLIRDRVCANYTETGLIEYHGNFVGFDLDLGVLESPNAISRRSVRLAVVLDGDAVDLTPGSRQRGVRWLCLGETLCLPYRQFAYAVVLEATLPLGTDLTNVFPRITYGFALTPPDGIGSMGGRLVNLPVETAMGGVAAAGTTTTGATADPGVFMAATPCRMVRLENTGANPLYWAKGVLATAAAHELAAGDGIDIALTSVGQLSLYAPAANPSSWAITPALES